MPKKLQSGFSDYSGELRRPIDVDRAHSETKTDDKAEHYTKFVKWIVDNQIAKIPVLLDHFGISRDHPACWHLLAFRLACEYVPGFRLPEPRGRKKYWHAQRAEL